LFSPHALPFCVETDYFKADKYDLGRKVSVETSYGDTKISADVKTGTAAALSKVKFSFKPSFGKIEVTEDFSKGVSLKFEVDNFVRENLDLESTHAADKVETALKYKPKESFWCAKFTSVYEPYVKGQRVCTGRASVALIDEKWNLAVGAQGEIVDKGRAGEFSRPNLQPSKYSMGFLYTPTEVDEFSLIYTPDKQAGGSRFQFSAFRKVNSEVKLALRADGKADLRKTENPPIIAIGGEYGAKGGDLMGFVNSNGEYGVSYKVKLGDAAKVTLGYSSFLNSDTGATQSKIGYKLALD
jgi:hypothetical protein